MARRQSQGRFMRIVALSIIVEAKKHGKEASRPEETHEGLILSSFVLLTSGRAKQERKVPS